VLERCKDYKRGLLELQEERYYHQKWQKVSMALAECVVKLTQSSRASQPSIYGLMNIHIQYFYDLYLYLYISIFLYFILFAIFYTDIISSYNDNIMQFYYILYILYFTMYKILFYFILISTIFLLFQFFCSFIFSI
jgi:hypothetical protein